MSSKVADQLAEDIVELDLRIRDLDDEAKEAQSTWQECLVGLEKLEIERKRLADALAVLNGECSRTVQNLGQNEELSEDLSQREDIAALDRKQSQPKGPYAEVSCSACGGLGTLYDTIQTMKGKPVPVLACTSCNSVRPR